MTARIVAAAQSWIGTPYVHQQWVKGAGCDCLGLLRGVWREVGGCPPQDVPAYTMDWAETSGHEALWQAAGHHLRPKSGPDAPGDVLLFRMADGAVAKHLGLQSAVGDLPRFIHAYNGHGVIESPLSAPWRRRIVARFVFPEIDAPLSGSDFDKETL